MNYMFLSCRKATELIEKKLLMGLSFKEKTQLVIHTGMCKACKRYAGQSQELDNLIKNHIDHFIPDPTNQQDNSKYKEQLINTLEELS